MTVRMICPCKQELLTEDTSIGKKVRCPSCNVLMVVPDVRPAGYSKASSTGISARGNSQYPAQNEAIIEEEYPEAGGRKKRPRVDNFADEYYDDDVSEAKRKKRAIRSALQITKVGLSLIYFGIICILAAIALSILTYIVMMITMGGVIATGGRGAGAQSAALGGLGIMWVLNVIGLVTNIAALILIVVGEILCCFAPAKAGRINMIISISLWFGTILVSILSFFLIFASAFAGGRDGITAGMVIAIVMVVIIIAMLLAAFIFFFLFLKKLAEYMKDWGSANEAMSIMITWLVVGIGGVLGMAGLAALSALLPPVAIILAIGTIAWFVYYVIQWLRLLSLIGALRAGIDRRV